MVKMACISMDEKSACINPSIATASGGSYPVSRPMFMYVNEPARVEVTNYIDRVLSQEGQCTILRKGYAPVRAVKCD